MNHSNTWSICPMLRGVLFFFMWIHWKVHKRKIKKSLDDENDFLCLTNLKHILTLPLTLSISFSLSFSLTLFPLTVYIVQCTHFIKLDNKVTPILKLYFSFKANFKNSWLCGFCSFYKWWRNPMLTLSKGPSSESSRTILIWLARWVKPKHSTIWGFFNNICNCSSF